MRPPDFHPVVARCLPVSYTWTAFVAQLPGRAERTSGLGAESLVMVSPRQKFRLVVAQILIYRGINSYND